MVKANAVWNGHSTFTNSPQLERPYLVKAALFLYLLGAKKKGTRNRRPFRKELALDQTAELKRRTESWR